MPSMPGAAQKLWSHHFDKRRVFAGHDYRVKDAQYLAVGANGCRGGHVAVGLPALFPTTIAIFALKG